MTQVKELIKKYWLYPVGAIVGGIAGYLYWVYIGCETGTCPITASPTRSSLYGALMGTLLFSILANKKQKQNDE